MLQRIILKIQGMHCASCAVLIEQALKKEQGIVSVSVNFASEKANIEFNKEDIKIKEIQDIVKKLGYQSEEENYDLITDKPRHSRGQTKNPEIKKLRNTFIISAILGVPIFYLVMGEMLGLPLPPLSIKTKIVIQFLISFDTLFDKFLVDKIEVTNSI